MTENRFAVGGEDWSRVLRPGADGRPGPSARKKRLLVIYRGLRVITAIDLGSFRSVPVDWPGASRLEQFARWSGYDSVVALEESAAGNVFSHARGETAPDSDYAEQLLALLAGVSREWRRTIFVYPLPLKKIPVIRYPTIARAARLAFRGDTILLFAVTEGGRTFASLAVGYLGGKFRLVTSLSALGMADRDLNGPGLRALARELAQRYGATARAAVIEREALRRMATGRFRAAVLLWQLNLGNVRLLRARPE